MRHTAILMVAVQSGGPSTMLAGIWDKHFARGGLGAGLVAILVVQALYWFAFTPFFKAVHPPESVIELSEADYARLTTPDQQGWQAAKFERKALPIEECCEPGYRGVRARFMLQELPARPLGIVMRMGSDNYTLQLNGSTIYQEGSLKLGEQTYHGNVRTVFRIPEGALRVGENEFQVIMVRDGGAPYFDFVPPRIADYAALASAMKYEMFTLNEFKFMSITAGAILAFLLGIVILRGRREPVLFWLMLVTIGWTARLCYFVTTDPPIHGANRMLYLFFFVNFVPLAWLNLANHFSGQPLRWISRISLAAFAILIPGLWTILQFGLFDHVDTVDQISMWFGLVMAMSAMALFLRGVLHNLQQRHIETALFILCLTLIVMDAVTTLLELPFVQHANRAMPFLVLGLVAAYLARNVRLFQSSASLNALLQTQLGERTAELEAAHAREKSMVRTKAHLAERQRIMRDMHDGLGSQLMSMLLMARRGQSEPAVMAEGLQSVIDEMRLMIDSMDSVGESLGTALTIFRERVSGRIEVAGKRLVWDDRSGGALPDFGPRDVLQVFRIMQEALTNALKHSSGETITVRIEPSPDPAFALRISVIDDGAGMGAVNPRGRGMANMTGRAETVGGRCTLADAGPGVAVVLDLPAQGRREAEGP
jgi:two-component system sensor histidine kinase UhpB